MRLTGSVTVNGVRVPLNWTIYGNRIESGAGLPCNDVKIRVNLADLANSSGDILPLEATEVLEIKMPEEGDYSNENLTELRVLLKQRELPVSGTKAELIARLIESDTKEGEDDGEEE
jgi:hypothetical protein|tara:strand:+ start:640 stop:990 length:351 start_codon:yes stop_codon:yes gene_type:complete